MDFILSWSDKPFKVTFPSQTCQSLYGGLESKFNKFESCFKSAENRIQLSAGWNLETLNTILSGTNHIWAASQIKAAAQIL